MPSRSRRRRGSTRSPARGLRKLDEAPLHVRLLLAIARSLRPVYRAFGVDPLALQELLHVKLMLDHRRKRRDGSTGMVSNVGFAMTVVLYALMGLALGLMAFVVESPMLYMALLASIIFLLLLMPLLADFSMVLLDTSDIELLAPLPLSDRTVIGVRITHISLYLLTLASALGFGPLVIGSLVYPPLTFVPVLLLSLLQVAALSLAGVIVMYLVALRSLDLSRFRDSLVYLQSGSFLILYMGSQLAPHVARRFGLVEKFGAHAELALAFPPAAGGALLRMALGNGQFLDPWTVGSGWVVTCLLVAWAALLARKGFVTQLAQLESSGGRARAHPRKHGITGRLSAQVPASTLERAGWNFFICMASSERIFKMRTMPIIVMMFLPLLLVFMQNDAEALSMARGAIAYMPYMLLLILPSVWDAARFSDSWEGRWVLDELDENESANFTRGAMKAVYVRHLAIPLGVFLVIAAFISGLQGVIAFTFAAGVALTAGANFLPRFGGDAPFTKKFAHSLSQSNIGLMFLAGIFASLLGLMHYLLSRLPHAIPLAALVTAVLAFHGWRRLGTVKLRRRRRRS